MINLLIRLIKCLDKKSLRKILYLQLFTFLATLSNIISAILIAPFILIISGKNLSINNPFFQKIFDLIDSFEKDNVLLYISLILVTVYSLSGIFTLIASYFNLKWTQDINASLQKKLYEYFINKNWLYHSNTSSKDLISKIHAFTARLSNTIIISYVELFSNLIITTMIISVIFLANLKIAIISTSIFFTFYSFFYFIFKKKLREAGDIITKINPIYYKSLYEGLSSIKDIILFDKKFYFKGNFNKSVEILKQMQIRQGYLVNIPRNVIEIIFFITLVGFMFILVKIFGYEFSEISVWIAFYSICAIKLIPALQKILKCFSLINSNQSAFFILEKDLINADIKRSNTINIRTVAPKEEIKFKQFIKLKNISFSYPGSKNIGLHHVNMEIPYASKIGIAGKTGSGKSTLIDIILGFISKENGEIIIDDTNINEENLKQWQEKLSYVPQNFNVYEGTIRSNIAFGLEEDLIDNNKVEEAMKIAELNEFIGNEHRCVGENGKKLSGGQRQRIGIARAIYKSSEVLVLDEATSALDTITEKKIIENLANNKNIRTTIIVSHRFETLKMCDKFYFVNNGHVKKINKFEELTKIYK
jgi:ATP-binding cassette, subfamily B, bacterial PglK